MYFDSFNSAFKLHFFFWRILYVWICLVDLRSPHILHHLPSPDLGVIHVLKNLLFFNHHWCCRYLYRWPSYIGISELHRLAHSSGFVRIRIRLSRRLRPSIDLYRRSHYRLRLSIHLFRLSGCRLTKPVVYLLFKTRLLPVKLNGAWINFSFLLGISSVIVIHRTLSIYD